MPLQEPPPVMPSKSSSRTILIIIGIALLVTAIGYLGFQNWQLNQQVNRLEKIIQVDNTPYNLSSPTPSTDPTANWKPYSFQGGFFKYPPSWNENPVLTGGSSFTQEIKDTEGLYSLTFRAQGNYSQLTGKPYATLEEFIGPPPNILEVLTIDGQQGGRILPRAGSENKNAVVFFSKDKKDIYTIELDTGSSAITDSRVTEESVKTGQELFDQILSTFKFLDQTTISNSCTIDTDCGVNICDCKADLNSKIKSEDKICTRYCPGTPKCINSTCQLVN